jgi:hypothetical protein
LRTTFTNITTVYFDVTPPWFGRIGSWNQHHSADRAVYHFRPEEECDHEPVTFITACMCTDLFFVFWPCSTTPPVYWAFTRIRQILWERQRWAGRYTSSTANVLDINSWVVIGIRNVLPEIIFYDPETLEESPLTDDDVLDEIVNTIDVPRNG